jgi:hypothetical protein
MPYQYMPVGQECYKKTDKCICNTIIKSIDTYEYEVWKMKEKIKNLLAL